MEGVESIRANGTPKSGELNYPNSDFEHQDLRVTTERKPLSFAAMPSSDLGWREFRLGSGTKERVWSIKVESDGQRFRIREGVVGGEIRESAAIHLGARGKPGQIVYLSSEEACQNEVRRRILQRIQKGYAELIDGERVECDALKLDFGVPFSRDIRTPKPEECIGDKEFRELHERGLSRVTRKYDGMGLVVVRHTFGWEMYTLSGNRVTEFYPKHLEALEKTKFGSGTVLKAESIMFNPACPEREDFTLMQATFGPMRNVAEVRALIDSGAASEPGIVFYDILYRDGIPLSDESYDQRRKDWQEFPVAKAGNGLLLSAEIYDVTPQNWREVRKKNGFEGFVVVDGSSVIGERIISFGSNVPRPKGSYKLKPMTEQDVVVYAVRQVDGVYESVFTKQRLPENFPGTSTPHPRAGEWFYSGRVSLLNMKDVIAKVDEYVQRGVIKVVKDNKEGESISINNAKGITATIEFFERFPSGKFRHPVFSRPVRFRGAGPDFKATNECVATVLGVPAPKASGKV